MVSVGVLIRDLFVGTQRPPACSIADLITDADFKPARIGDWIDAVLADCPQPAAGAAPGLRQGAGGGAVPPCGMPREVLEELRSGYGHKGIMAVARNLIANLREKGVPEAFLPSHSASPGPASPMRRRSTGGASGEGAAGSADGLPTPFTAPGAAPPWQSPTGTPAAASLPTSPRLSAQSSRRGSGLPPLQVPSSPASAQSGRVGPLRNTARHLADLPWPLTVRAAVPRVSQKDWRIIVTGHSLGAGIAVFVLLWLRLAFPNARSSAWLFGCPAGLLSAAAADVLAPACTQVVLGKDVIARLSLRTFHRLRDEMISARCVLPF